VNRLVCGGDGVLVTRQVRLAAVGGLAGAEAVDGWATPCPVSREWGLSRDLRREAA